MHWQNWPVAVASSTLYEFFSVTPAKRGSNRNDSFLLSMSYDPTARGRIDYWAFPQRRRSTGPMGSNLNCEDPTMVGPRCFGLLSYSSLNVGLDEVFRPPKFGADRCHCFIVWLLHSLIGVEDVPRQALLLICHEALMLLIIKNFLLFIFFASMVKGRHSF